MARIKKANPLLYFNLWQSRYLVRKSAARPPPGGTVRWRLPQSELPSTRRKNPFSSDFVLSRRKLRWFGRPVKYTYGRNEIWLHVEKNRRWTILKLKLDHTDMRKLVRTLKLIATPEQVEAYRRRRPYIHHGPVGGVSCRPGSAGRVDSGCAGNALSDAALLVVMHRGQVLRAFALDKIRADQRLKTLGYDRRGWFSPFSDGERGGRNSLLRCSSMIALPMTWQKRPNAPWKTRQSTAAKPNSTIRLPMTTVMRISSMRSTTTWMWLMKARSSIWRSSGAATRKTPAPGLISG